MGLLTTLLLALSPWHILFGRAGFECTASLFFFILGIYLFCRGLELLLGFGGVGARPWSFDTCLSCRKSTGTAGGHILGVAVQAEAFSKIIKTSLGASVFVGFSWCLATSRSGGDPGIFVARDDA